MICGVDEAGKGSVLGPMVVAAVGAPSEDIFSDMNVKDSKLLSHKERERLAVIIRKQCRVATVILDAQAIDAARKEMTMNECVARAHAEVIRQIAPDIAYVDACDVNPSRYAGMVKKHLGSPCKVVSEHHADQTFLVVSAASIIAKVTRDREITILSEEFGRIGSGYPSDPVTIAFLSAYIKSHDAPPPIARKSWKTVSAMLVTNAQSRLTEFF